LEVHRRDLAAAPTPQQQAIFDQGHAIGLLARELFPGGVLIEEGPFQSQQALESTERAVQRGARILYEAAAAFEGTYARADILTRNEDGTWDLIEVKGSTSLSEHYHHDVALQRHAFEGAGYRVRKTFLCHLDRAYVRRGPLDLPRLFRLDDITPEVLALLPAIPGRLRSLFETLEREDAPPIPIGSRCFKPFDCPFEAHCWKDVPKGSVFELTRGMALAESLFASGITRLSDIPEGTRLQRQQALQVEAARDGKPHLNAEAIRRFLAKASYPLHYLDFEAFTQALPPFDGTSPFQHIPFQFSLHLEAAKGAPLEHREFLSDGPGDPRRAFSEALLEAIGPSGTILTYSPYENRILGNMRDLFPDLAKALEGLAARTLDLAIPFRNGDVLDASFQGSHSIKKVLPVLVPGMGYEGLAVAQGMEAVNAYHRLRKGDTPEAERSAIRRALLEYCGQDTLAMVKLMEALQRFASA
jgi:hypothetical protein